MDVPPPIPPPSQIRIALSPSASTVSEGGKK